jgi:hypothetical protein
MSSCISDYDAISRLFGEWQAWIGQLCIASSKLKPIISATNAALKDVTKVQDINLEFDIGWLVIFNHFRASCTNSNVSCCSDSVATGSVILLGHGLYCDGHAGMVSVV